LRKEKPEDIIAAMYDMSQLAVEETAVLSAFAVLPAESIAFAMLATLLPDAAELEQTLLALAQKGWIEYNKDAAAFKCSPVVQEIAKKKNPQLYENCAPLIAALTEKLEYEPGTGHFLNATYDAAAVFARYAASVVAAFSEAKDEIAILCERIGSYHSTTGNLEQALRFFEERSKLGKELYDAYPTNVSFKNGLAISYEKLGDTHTALGNLEQALRFFEDETDLFKELYDAYPTNVSFKNGLAISYSKLGDTHTALGNLEQALRFFEERSKLGKELYDAYPTNVSFKNGLAISFIKLGSLHEKRENHARANEYYSQSAGLLSQLVQSFPKYVEFKKNLAWVQNKLSEK